MLKSRILLEPSTEKFGVMKHVMTITSAAMEITFAVPASPLVVERYRKIIEDTSKTSDMHGNSFFSRIVAIFGEVANSHGQDSTYTMNERIT